MEVSNTFTVPPTPLFSMYAANRHPKRNLRNLPRRPIAARYDDDDDDDEFNGWLTSDAKGCIRTFDSW